MPFQERHLLIDQQKLDHQQKPLCPLFLHIDRSIHIKIATLSDALKGLDKTKQNQLPANNVLTANLKKSLESPLLSNAEPSNANVYSFASISLNLGT